MKTKEPFAVRFGRLLAVLLSGAVWLGVFFILRSCV